MTSAVGVPSLLLRSGTSHNPLIFNWSAVFSSDYRKKDGLVVLHEIRRGLYLGP